MSKLKLKGKYILKHYREGKLLKTLEFPNGIVNVGKDSLLDIMFHATSQITAWFFGLIDAASYTTGIAATDTMASHGGWIEFVTYSEGTRPAWPENAASGQAIINITLADFSITGSGVLKGAFLTSDSAKSGSSGTLWSTALFETGDLSVANGDTVRLQYEVSVSG